MNIQSPVSVVRRYTQTIQAEASKVFPLLCPVREAEWIEGWDPDLVISDSGVAEPDCVFVTPAEPQAAVWFVTRHDAEAGVVEMIKLIPGLTVCKLNIQLHDQREGCMADITYKLISLAPAGDEAVAAFSEAHYREFMQAWERRINHYLLTGQRLAEDGARIDDSQG